MCVIYTGRDNLDTLSFSAQIFPIIDTNSRANWSKIFGPNLFFLHFLLYPWKPFECVSFYHSWENRPLITKKISSPCCENPPDTWSRLTNHPILSHHPWCTTSHIRVACFCQLAISARTAAIPFSCQIHQINDIIPFSFLILPSLTRSSKMRIS